MASAIVDSSSGSYDRSLPSVFTNPDGTRIGTHITLHITHYTGISWTIGSFLSGNLHSLKLQTKCARLLLIA